MRKFMLVFGLLLIGVAVAVVVIGLQNTETIPYEVHEVPQDRAADANGEEVGIDWDSLPESVVAWVRVPGTTVDYPIVQEEANNVSFYLEHDMNGDYSAWGTPYIDAGCEKGAESPLVMVYGHHMSDGTMFAPLAQYSDAAFAEEHETIYVYTRTNTYKLRVFAVDVLDASVEGVQTGITDADALQSYLASKLSDCEVVLEQPGALDQAWAFITCSYETGNSRTVVYAADADAL